MWQSEQRTWKCCATKVVSTFQRVSRKIILLDWSLLKSLFHCCWWCWLPFLLFSHFFTLHSSHCAAGSSSENLISRLFFSSSSSSSWLGVCECGEHFSIGIFILSIVETEEKLNFLLSSSVCVSVENKVEKSHQHNQISTQAQARRDQRKKSEENEEESLLWMDLITPTLHKSRRRLKRAE